MNLTTTRLTLVSAWVLLAPVFVCTTAPDSQAKSFYLDDFNDAYGTTDTRLDTCGVCQKTLRE